jgi:4-hydroxy-tetrahydrodipicolinate synthase
VLIDTLIEAKVDGILCGGSSGEFYALQEEERIVSLRFCRQAAAGRLPVFANVGCITTRDTVRLAQAAQAEGLDVAVVITPYYIKPTQQELADHYMEVCRAVRIPVLAYNFPQHGGVEIAPETLGQVAARCENLAGVKDSGGSLAQASAYRTCAPDRELAVFVGPEGLLLPALQQGCAGAVSACANIAPRVMVDLVRAFDEGRTDETARLHELAVALGRAAGLHTFPSILKEAMRMAGIPAGPCRKPVGAVTPEARAQLAVVIGRLAQEV